MTATPPPAEFTPMPSIDRTAFVRRLKIATYSIVLLVLTIHLLR